MDLLDLIVIVVAVMAAIGGYRLGFVGRVASWLGLALGLYVAIRLLPTVLLRLSRSSPGTQLAVSVLLLVGGAMLGQALASWSEAGCTGPCPWGRCARSTTW